MSVHRVSQLMLVALAALCAASAPPALAQETPPPTADPCDCEECDGNPYRIDFAEHVADGDRILGPACIRLYNINPLKYAIEIDGEVSFEDGPSLAGLPFGLRALPKAGEATPPPSSETLTAAATEAESALDAALAQATDVGTAFRAPEDDGTRVRNAFDKLKAELDAVQAALRPLTAIAKTSREELARTKNEVQEFVQGSDDVLAIHGENGPRQLAADAKNLATAVRSALENTPWPDQQLVDDLQGKLAEIRTRLTDLPKAVEGFPAWWNQTPNSQAYDKALDAIAKALQTVAQLDRKGEGFTEYRKLRRELESWLALLDAVDEASAYERKLCARCGHPWVSNKKLAITVSSTERIATGDAAETVSRHLVTVECPSVLSITGGMSLSGIAENDVGFVQSLEDVDPNDPDQVRELENEFGFKNRADEQVNPLLLINTRLRHYGKSRGWALHATAGTVFDLDSPDKNVEFGYLLGLSVSLRDSIFLTAGGVASRVPRLAGGFEIGDTVPEGVSEPPLQREWETGWIVAVSYKIN